LIYEPLLLEDKSYQVRPYLAEAWEISKDGLVYIFSIKKGVKFHNGSELVAGDIKWSIEYIQDPNNAAYGSARLRPIASIQISEPYKLHISLKEPMASFLSLLTTLQTLPVLPKESLKTGERPQAFPPGTGPYRFVQWKPGQGVLVSRFQDYWQKGIPRMDRIEFKHVPDDEARFAALRAGDLDLIERLPLQYVPKVQKGEMPGIRIEVAEGTGLKGLVFNTQKPPFDNVKMRQMVAYALDPREVLRGAYWGVGTVTSQKMFPGSPWYFPIPERKRDLATARRLLKEAGYGSGFRFKLSGTRNVAEELYVIQSQLREAGIEAEIRLKDQIENLKSYTTGDFELASTAADISIDPDRNYFDSFHTELQEGKGRLRNYSGYSNPLADKLLQEGRRTLDPQKRYKIYREFVELIHQELPVLYLLISPNLYVYRVQLKAFEMKGEGRYFSGDTGIPLAWLER
jgi:ABC-type transport system substrate-binding protein